MDSASSSDDQNGSTTQVHCQQTDPVTGLPVNPDEFLNTGRTGRRNALGDILDQTSAFLTTADLPDQFQSLSFSGDGKF